MFSGPQKVSTFVKHSHTHTQNELAFCKLITRVASWGPDHRKWLFSEVRGGIWTPHSPMLTKISADKRPLSQLTVTKVFFFIIHQSILPSTPSYCSWKKQLIWVFEWRKSVHYWWSYILFSPECKELTSMLDPLLQVGCPTYLLLSGVCTGPCKCGYCRPGLKLRALPS